VGKGNQVRRRETAVLVLKPVQELEQEIASARLVTEKRAHLLESRRVECSSLRPRAAALAAGTGVARPLPPLSLAPFFRHASPARILRDRRWPSQQLQALQVLLDAMRLKRARVRHPAAAIY
jgi:hypothetical protein